jgi:CRISPR-associated protein Cmr2
MNGYLFAAWLGPVQTFISAARRTRDLSVGSLALSEAAKAAARELRHAGAELIFPAPDSDDQLVPGCSFNAANKLLAEIPNGRECREVAARAAEAARAAWRELAGDALQNCRTYVDVRLWDEQIDDVLEWAAAWLPRSEDYQQDRATLESLLAGRRMLRDFSPAKGAAVPKSSLDGSRESVLLPNRGLPHEIGKGEELDAVGMIKRFALKERRFPSVTRIAADHWVRRLQAESPAGLDRLVRVVGAIPRGLLPGVPDAAYAAFPFEADVLYPGLLDEHRQETTAAAANTLNEVNQVLRELGRGTPSPYFALLLADGDHMGKLLGTMTSPDAHRRLSGAMARFASQAAEIVTGRQGTLVYSGGDDVLAFLPLDTCLGCARDLHEAFAASLAPAVGDNAATLSVGIAVVHHVDPLGDSLDLARAAEQAAKSGWAAAGLPDSERRDALAIVLRSRSGGELRLREGWGRRPDERIELLSQLLAAGETSARTAYDVTELAGLYQRWPTHEKPPADLVKRDLARILARKRESKGASPKFLQQAEHVQDAAGLDALAVELRLAAHLSATTAPSSGGR